MELIEVVRAHVKKYPEIQPQDIFKLVFQNEFGPAHLVADPSRTLAYLKQEYGTVSHSGEFSEPEPIGNGLVRIYLESVKEESELERINDAFVKTANSHKGSEDSFIEKIEQVKNNFDDFGFGFSREEFETFSKEYFANGVHPVHHSALFTQKYHPAYRVVNMKFMNYKELVKQAIEAKKHAYCVYSHYPVGAALLTEEGKIFTGCNIECVSFSPTVCAERTAFFKAVSEGYENFTAIAVAAGVNSSEYPSPCGVCRQVMREFCNPETFEVILAKSEDDYVVYKLEDLIPHSFGPDRLN